MQKQFALGEKPCLGGGQLGGSGHLASEGALELIRAFDDCSVASNACLRTQGVERLRERIVRGACVLLLAGLGLGRVAVLAVV